MRAEGLDPAVNLVASRLDRDVGKHGTTGGAELAQLARLRVGELDGAVCSNSVLDAIARQGSDEDRREVWRCAPFNHCNFTVLDDTAGAHAEFARLLLSMNAADPKLCEPMEPKASTAGSRSTRLDMRPSSPLSAAARSSSGEPCWGARMP